MGELLRLERPPGDDDRSRLERLLREKARAARSFELSFAQERLWFIEQLDPGQASYNIPAAVRVTGSLDVRTLERCFAEVVRRHESLRTTFVEVAGRPRQRVAPPGVSEVPVEDLSGVLATRRADLVLRRAGEEARRSFDLSRGPLVRLRLLRLGAEQHVLLLNLHHIVSDGWSMGVLVREIAVLYGAFTAGRPSPLAPLSIQYADFAHWQRDWLRGETLDRQLDYWKARLADLPTLRLPADHPRPRLQTFRGENFSFRCTPALTEAVERLSRSEGATSFMFLLAAFQALLSRHAGQEDLAVGSPIAGRNRREIEGLIGFFVNTLVLRADFSGNPTFREALARVRASCLAAYAHQDLPFEKLVERLAPERDLSRTPLFQAMFVLQNLPAVELELPGGVALAPLELDTGAAKFDLTLSMARRDGAYHGAFEYNRDLFEPETIAQLADHFVRLLLGIVADPDRGVFDLPLLDEQERKRLLVEWNGRSDGPRDEACIHRRFEAQVVRAPDALALVCGPRTFSYRALDDWAERLARRFRSEGVGPEVLAGLCLARSPEMIAAVLGVLKAGGAYLPLDPDYPRERLAFMLQDASPRVLVTVRSLVERLPLSDARVICLDDDEQPPPRAATPAGRSVDPQNLAYVIYTSGSTGRPKGTLLAHAGLSRLASFQERAFGVGPGHRVLQFAALSYDASVWESFMALASGATLCLASSEDLLPGRDLLHVLREQEITIVTLPPSVLAVLPEGELPALSTVVAAGESCAADLVRRWGSGRRFFNAYGPTESTVCATIEVCSADDPFDPSIGGPIDGAEVFVLDGRGEPVPVGVPGELHIGGAGLARGYLGRPAQTAERFVPHPFSNRPGARLYRTGDLCRWRRDGHVQFLGRIDQQVKVRGFRIELGEIEAALREVPEVSQAVVLAREDVVGDRRLVAYLVCAGEAVPSAQDLRTALGRDLPEFMVPAAFVWLETLPLSPSGKVDRAALPAPDMRRQVGQAYVAPRTPVEAELARQWAELLQVDRVGVHDGFFELGGHSLLATQLMSRMRESFRVELPLRALFEKPTVAGLAAALEQAEPSLASPIERIPRDAAPPLSFAQERLWFLDQLVPEGAFYNLPVAVRIEGPLDVGILERSFQEIVRRHEVLRASFTSVDGRAVQQVASEVRLALPVVDLATLGKDARERRANELARIDARRPFRLAHGPLLRVSLLRTAPAEHVLLLTLHHIVADGWSMGVLLSELAVAYRALFDRRAIPLPELAVQYADYAAWQRAWLGEQRLERLLAYWKHKLAGLPVLELPTDRMRPAVRTFRGATTPFCLPGSLVRAITALAERESATPFMVLLASFQLLLGRLAGQQDLAVGTPIAGRNRGEIEGLIGLFVNTLVLRADLADDPPFVGLLRRVRDVCLEAYAHQDLPFEKLVEELRPERDLSRESLFQVMFTLQNLPNPRLDLPGGVRFAVLPPEGGTAKFDLTLSLSEGTPDWHGAFEFNRDLFDPVTIEIMIERWLRLLHGIAEHPDLRLSELPILSEDERRRLLVEWNRTEGTRDDRPITHHIAAAVARSPGAVALSWEGGRLTYAELDRRSDALARRLRALGASAEAVVALCLDRSPEMVVAALATLKAGCAYAPLAPDHPVERLRQTMEDLRPAVVITSGRLAFGMPAGTRLLRLDEDGSATEQVSDAALPEVAWPHSLAYVIHTSGSTGRPKGVAVSHAALANLVAWHRETYHVVADDRASLIAAVTFDAAVWEIWPYLAAGAGVHLVPDTVRANPAELPDWIATHGITTSFLPTPLFEAIPEDAWPAGSRLRLLLTGGDRLHRAPRATLPFRLFNHYGPTENAVVATSVEVEAAAPRSGPPPIGRPIANVRAYLLDERLQLVPPGAPGELYVCGSSLARGYVRRPDLTAERFLPDPFGAIPGGRMYRTGDRCRLLSDGNLEFLGRIDDQVKIRGVRIELGEVEAVLTEHPDVLRAAIVARETAGGERKLAAYVEFRPGIDGESVDLRGHLRLRLPEAMIPAAFFVLETLPLTPHGKVDRKALPVDERTSIDRAAHVPPRTPTEERMARVWCEVLEVERVGARDNFFELGGHSLSAVRLVAAIEREWGSKLPVALLFQGPTVEQLATLVDSGGATVDPSVLVELQAGGTAPPFFCVHQDTGLATSYAALAHRLGPGRPFYGLQSPDLLGDEEPCAVVEQMASRYVQAIRSVQPVGPYHLGGHSFGGYVAFEMARQLERAGHGVRLVALIDTSAPLRDSSSSPSPFSYDEVERLVSLAHTVERFTGVSLGLAAEDLRPLGSKERYALFLERVARERETANAGVPGQDLAPKDVLDLLLAGGQPMLERSLSVSRACTQAARAYRPGPYSGRVTLFRSEEIDPNLTDEVRSDPSLGWDAVCGEPSDVQFVRGDHQSMITEPHVADLAARLAASLKDG